MTKSLRFWTAAFLIVPAVSSAWFVLLHLWRLYVGAGAYSFGFHLRFGAVRVTDPVSDAVVLFCVVVAIVCGIGIARDTKRRTLALAVGIAAAAITIVGVIGAA